MKPSFTSFHPMRFPGKHVCDVREEMVTVSVWALCGALAPSHFPLGRGPLHSSNLCLLLIYSLLGTLMWGVWRKPFPRPWAGLKRTQLPWCVHCFGPDSTVATERRFPLGEGALEAHLFKESDGWDGICCCGSHGKHVNESTLILIFRLGCDVKHDYKTFPLKLVNRDFMGCIFYKSMWTNYEGVFSS